MSVPERLQGLAGTYRGTKQLLLPGESPRLSDSVATVALAAQGKFSTIAYSWSFEDEAQDGLLLLGAEQEANAIHGVWIDSWHMGDVLMTLHGQIEADARVVARGSYAAGAGPDWGWKIVIELQDDAFRLLMYNISPDGDEMLGVDAAFTRTG